MTFPFDKSGEYSHSHLQSNEVTSFDKKTFMTSVFPSKDLFRFSFGSLFKVSGNDSYTKISFGNNHKCSFSFDSRYKLLKLIRSFSGEFTFVFMYNPHTAEVILVDNPYISLVPISIISKQDFGSNYLQERSLLNLETLIDLMEKDFKSIFIGSGYNISTHCLWNEVNYFLEKILLTVKLG